ncbi:MAG: GGDEF domain-containing protein, partial [Candidatus Dormibacteraeota bacterium]|nr:GGDEF domain-containing protein [Candidatus Dormibacteraeota bacterium]
AEGDRLLKDLTTLISRRLRSHDIVFRYGGDEFVCILPGADLAGANRILQSISRSFAQQGRGHRFSFGVAERCEDDTPEGLVARADAALYAGRVARAGHPGRQAHLAPA